MEKHCHDTPLKQGEILVRTNVKELEKIAAAAGEKALVFFAQSQRQQEAAVQALSGGDRVGYEQTLEQKQKSIEAADIYGALESDVLTVLTDIPE